MIEEYLAALSRDETVYYFPNPGDAGDALIACATFQLFDKLKLKYVIIKRNSFVPDGKTVVYGGGGNLVPLYERGRMFIKEVHLKVKKLVVLPHTIAGNEDLLREFGGNVDVFCREEISFTHVRKNAPRANVMLADDMAFHLDMSMLIKAGEWIIPRLFLTKAGDFLFRRDANKDSPSVEQAFLAMKQICLSWLSGSELNAFREDCEKTGKSVPINNKDISLWFAIGTQSREIVDFSSFYFLKFLSRFRIIRTNRLHCAIAAGLLGKQVFLYPNSYYKNGAVWRFSMKGKMPNVRWMAKSLIRELPSAQEEVSS